MPRRRWFRYSLRTFLILTALLGTWLGVQVKWKRDRDEVRKTVRCWSPAMMMASGVPMPATAPWSLRLLGEEPVSGIVADFNDKTRLARLRELFPEATVHYPGNRGTDE